MKSYPTKWEGEYNDVVEQLFGSFILGLIIQEVVAYDEHKRQQ